MRPKRKTQENVEKRVTYCEVLTIRPKTKTQGATGTRRTYCEVLTMRPKRKTPRSIWKKGYNETEEEDSRSISKKGGHTVRC